MFYVINKDICSFLTIILLYIQWNELLNCDYLQVILCITVNGNLEECGTKRKY